MSRYSQDVLERIKGETDLPSLVRAKGVALSKQGGNFLGLCPFHNDTKESFVLTQKDGIWLWNCLGACNCGGDVIAWVMKSEGVSFRHAVEILLNGNGHHSPTSDKIIKKATIRHLPSPVEITADDQTVLNQVLDYYHEALKKTPAALDYLENRGLVSEEAFSTFKIGFADRTLGLRIPAANRKEGKEIRERLARIGILRASGHEHFNGCVVFPVMDEKGIISEIYGRKINDNLRSGTAYHLYLPGPHKGIWNPHALGSREIIVCESIIDALTFWIHGFRNVTASYGVNGFTDEMFSAFVDHGVRVVYLAYDRDDAGEKASLDLGSRLLDAGLDCYRVTFPHGMDANEYALKVAPADKSLRLLVQSASWMGKGKTKNVVRPVDLQGDVTITPEKDETAPSPLAAQEAEKQAAKKNKGADRNEPATADKIAVPATVKGESVEITFEDRSYRILGLSKNMAYGVLKVNVRLMVGEKYHVDTLDLYSFRNRSGYIKNASREVGISEETIKVDMGKVLLKLEELQEEKIKKITKPKKKEITLSDAQRHEALSFLKKPNLLDCILTDFEKCGVVGEDTNKLIGYLACVSRNLQKPLGIIIQSSSAAGKTYLMESLLSFIPPEGWKKYSAMTGQSLFYMGETDLKYKVLAIVEEEGADRASYPLKLLQSEGELTIASTGKDPTSGRLVTHVYRIEGPVVIIITTTNIEIDEELQNRCIILTVNEDRDQTRAIHKLQRELETLEGHRAQWEWEHIRDIHRNAQRLLRPLTVVNPYARYLTFLDNKTRTRRDHVKYLTLINAIALLHQYQRPIKTDIYKGKPMKYIEVTLEDIEIANKLANEALGRSLDELTPQTRRFLGLIDGHVSSQCNKRQMLRHDYRFSRREIREVTGWSYDQVRAHLERLVELEYVLVHRGGRGQSFVYELLYDGKGRDGGHFLMGLLDVDALRNLKNTSMTKSLGIKKSSLGS